MTTPTQLLDALVGRDPSRPRLTWYDDADGRTRGERIELSGRVLANWVAKAANLLTDELGVERSDVVVIDLPVHWRGVYWALAVWRVGATVSLDGDARAAVVVTDRPGHAAHPTGPRLVAVSLPALARAWDGPPLEGTLDEAADLSGQPDVFAPYDEPETSDLALAGAGGGLSAEALGERARALAAERGWASGERVALAPAPGARLGDGVGDGPGLLVDVLAAWTVDGSVVLVRDGDDDASASRWRAERVTSVCGPGGTRASRP